MAHFEPGAGFGHPGRPDVMARHVSPDWHIHECQSRLTLMDVESLTPPHSCEDPAVGLRASLALRRVAERVEAMHVALARERGWSWQQIGDALGVTRQSVHAKYNRESS